MVDTDVVYIVPYSCPRCQAPLEARSSEPPVWLRCPSCGKAGLPPEPARNSRSPLPFIDDEPAILGQFSTGVSSPGLPLTPRRMAPLPAPATPRTPTTRLLLGSGFFLSTALFVFSLLGSNSVGAGLFALGSIACFVLLIRRPGRPSLDE